jgi:hypothetical protein
LSQPICAPMCAPNAQKQYKRHVRPAWPSAKARALVQSTNGHKQRVQAHGWAQGGKSARAPGRHQYMNSSNMGSTLPCHRPLYSSSRRAALGAPLSTTSLSCFRKCASSAPRACGSSSAGHTHGRGQQPLHSANQHHAALQHLRGQAHGNCTA